MTNFFKILPEDIVDTILSKVATTKDLLQLRSTDKLLNRLAFEHLFKPRDRKSIDIQTKLLFLWIRNNPLKLVKYCDNRAMKFNWIRMLSEELKNEDADWASQFSRLFFINALLEGPVIPELNGSSIIGTLSPDIMNDTTGRYDSYLFYIAQLYPDKVYDFIVKMDVGQTDPQRDPERKRIGLLARLYTAFPPSIQKQLFDYILKVLPDSLNANYLHFEINSTATAKNLVAIIKMAFQLNIEDRNRIKTIINNAYVKNRFSSKYDDKYLDIVFKILSAKNETSINRFINTYDFYGNYSDSRYYPLGEWLLEQVSSTDFARIIGLAGTVNYHTGYITWVRHQFHGRMDVSLIDEALYNTFVRLINDPSTDFNLIRDIVKASSTKGIAKLHEYVHQKQLEGITDFITKIQVLLCYNHESFSSLTDFPSYLPLETVQELIFDRFVFGKPLHHSWLNDFFVTFPRTPPPEFNNDNDIYSQYLAVAPYTALMTPAQASVCIDVLLKLLIYNRTKKLSIPPLDCYNENVDERTYIALLKLVPKMSSEQSVRFENSVLQDLSLKTDHAKLIAEILFSNRTLIGEQLANRLINIELLNIKNMRLLIVMRAERYTCTEPDLTTEASPTPK